MNDTEDDEMSKISTASNLKVPCPPMTVVELEIGMIEVGTRMRLANDGHVADLGKDIADRGLMEPITVFLIKNDGQASYRLSGGLHRLTACKNLGKETIPAFVKEGNELDCELWEIDDNLLHHPLTQLERGDHLVRRKEIYDAKGGRIQPTLGGDQKIGFAKDTEEKTGTPKRSTNVLVKIAKAIPDDVKEQIHGTAIAKNKEELKALADASPDVQREAVAAVESGKFKSVRAALRVNAPPDTEKQLKDLKRDWRNADASVQDRFLQSIGAKIDGKGPPAAAASTKVGVGLTDEEPGKVAANKPPDPFDILPQLVRRSGVEGAIADDCPSKAAASSG